MPRAKQYSKSYPGCERWKVWEECNGLSLEIIFWLAGLIGNFKVDIIYTVFSCSKLGKSSPQVRGSIHPRHNVFLLVLCWKIRQRNTSQNFFSERNHGQGPTLWKISYGISNSSMSPLPRGFYWRRGKYRHPADRQVAPKSPGERLSCLLQEAKC